MCPRPRSRCGGTAIETKNLRDEIWQCVGSVNQSSALQSFSLAWQPSVMESAGMLQRGWQCTHVGQGHRCQSPCQSQNYLSDLSQAVSKEHNTNYYDILKPSSYHWWTDASFSAHLRALMERVEAAFVILCVPNQTIDQVGNKDLLNHKLFFLLTSAHERWDVWCVRGVDRRRPVPLPDLHAGVPRRLPEGAGLPACRGPAGDERYSPHCYWLELLLLCKSGQLTPTISCWTTNM